MEQSFVINQNIAGSILAALFSSIVELDVVHTRYFTYHPLSQIGTEK